jgi:hypothetical protein
MVHKLTDGVEPLLAGRTAGHDQPVLTEGRKVVMADFKLDRRD